MRVNFSTLLLLMLLGFSLPSAANTDLKTQLTELEAALENKTQSRQRFQSKLEDNKIKKRELRQEVTALEVDLKQNKLETRKIESMASNPPSATDTNKLNTLAYKRRVAEISLNKSKSTLTLLQEQEKKISGRITRLDKVLINMNKEHADLQQQWNNRSEAQAIAAKAEKARKQALYREKKAAAKKRQQKALAEKKRKQQQLAQAKQKKALQKKQQQQQNVSTDADKIAQLTANLPPAEAALKRAEYFAKKPMQGAPTFGESPALMVINPIGSKPKKISNMQHLGNNQYTATIQVKKGRQQYQIGDVKFTKSIPKHFNGIRCLVVIDARQKQANFQLIATKG